MGIPKFYRWISERYPCLSEVISETQVPHFDCLYLDMNGIIHVCSHPSDDVHFRMSESDMFQDICRYIEVLFRIISPKKTFFMAVDGVAPRAKMNQQRARRFKTAKDAEKKEEEARQQGELLPSEPPFDSNCITPGTGFMDRLHHQLQFFTASKISTDEKWRNVQVILSGHDVPGEGEHKIMDFIRYQRSQPDYDPNTRHCMYGLDADLIMLGLCSHEPHFSLLREEIRFGKFGKGGNNSRVNVADKITFHLLHLSLLREYLELEFNSLQGRLSFPFDLEKIVDDWILMGFLVGNDFIPHIPFLHINKNALPTLHSIYMEVLPTLGGYINEGGYLNLQRFEAFCQAAGRLDRDYYDDLNADMQWMKSKRLGDAIIQHHESHVLPDINSSPASTSNPKWLDELAGANISDSEEEDEEEAAAKFAANDELEYHHWKRSYYIEKFKVLDPTPEFIREQTVVYVRAIQWNLHYYYHGVQSWSWFYEQHYAPFISDLKDFSTIDMSMELSEPFHPFEQLLAVLPTRSRVHLPECFQALMMENSPIADFYPKEFEQDLNGKQMDWEAVVLVPFIEEKRLLKAMDPLRHRMTSDEQRRNAYGYMLVYRYDGNMPGFEYKAPRYFPPLANCKARVEKLAIDHFRIAREDVKEGLLPGVRLDVYFEGFPTMKHLSYTGSLECAGVRVFQANSRGHNMIIRIDPAPECSSIESLKKLYFEGGAADHPCYTRWPYLKEAKVVAISDGSVIYEKDDQGSVSKRELDGKEMRMLRTQLNQSMDWYHDKRGVKLATDQKVPIFLSVVELSGRKHMFSSDGKVKIEKRFSSNPEVFPAALCVNGIKTQSREMRMGDSLEDIYSPGMVVFILGLKNYGHQAEVTGCTEDHLVSYTFVLSLEPNFSEIIQKEEMYSMQYYNQYEGAQQLNIPPLVLSRITGSLFVYPPNGRGGSQDVTPKNTPTSTPQRCVNIGLNLKFNKSNEEVLGYTRRSYGDGGWLYSQKCLDIVRDYVDKFPEMFARLSQTIQSDRFAAEQIMGSDPEPTFGELQEYLKQLPCASAQKISCSSKVLEEQILHKIQHEVERCKVSNKRSKTKMVGTSKPNLLFRPVDVNGTLLADESVTFELYDRVVNIRDGFSVPLGLRGTVIGLPSRESRDQSRDSLYDVLFDEEFLGAHSMLTSWCSVYKVPAYSLINLSHGLRKQNAKSGGKPNQPRIATHQSAGTPRLSTQMLFASASPQVPQILTRDQPLPSTSSNPIFPLMQKPQQDNSSDIFQNLVHQMQKIAPLQQPGVVGSPLVAPSQPPSMPPLLLNPAKPKPEQMTGRPNLTNPAEAVEFCRPFRDLFDRHKYLEQRSEPVTIKFEQYPQGVRCNLTVVGKNFKGPLATSELESLTKASFELCDKLNQETEYIRQQQYAAAQMGIRQPVISGGHYINPAAGVPSGGPGTHLPTSIVPGQVSNWNPGAAGKPAEMSPVLELLNRAAAAAAQQSQMAATAAGPFMQPQQFAQSQQAFNAQQQIDAFNRTQRTAQFPPSTPESRPTPGGGSSQGKARPARRRPPSNLKCAMSFDGNQDAN